MPNDDPKTFYDRLLWGLRAKGHSDLSQTTVAKLVGKNQSQASRWKAGESLPDLQDVVELAKQAGITVEWLLSGRGPRRPSEGLPPDLGVVADFWEKLPLEVRAEIVGFAKYKRSITFTGDQEKREAYQEQIGHKGAKEPR